MVGRGVCPQQCPQTKETQTENHASTEWRWHHPADLAPETSDNCRASMFYPTTHTGTSKGWAWSLTFGSNNTYTETENISTPSLGEPSDLEWRGYPARTQARKMSDKWLCRIWPLCHSRVCTAWSKERFPKEPHIFFERVWFSGFPKQENAAHYMVLRQDYSDFTLSKWSQKWCRGNKPQAITIPTVSQIQSSHGARWSFNLAPDFRSLQNLVETTIPQTSIMDTKHHEGKVKCQDSAWMEEIPRKGAESQVQMRVCYIKHLTIMWS